MATTIVTGEFGELRIESEPLIRPSPDESRTVFAYYDPGPASYYLNDQPITEDDAKAILSA